MVLLMKKMWVSSFLNEKRVLYIAREANATGQRLVDDGSFYLKDEESSRKKRIFQRIIAIQNIIKSKVRRKHKKMNIHILISMK